MTGAPPRGRNTSCPSCSDASNAIGQRQRLDGGARPHRPVDHIAVRPFAERGRVDIASSPASARIVAIRPSSGAPPSAPVSQWPVSQLAPSLHTSAAAETPDRAARPRSTDGWRTDRSSGRHTRGDTGLRSLWRHARDRTRPASLPDSGAASDRRAGRLRNAAWPPSADFGIRKRRSAGSRPCRPRDSRSRSARSACDCGIHAVGDAEFGAADALVMRAATTSSTDPSAGTSTACRARR